MSACLWLAPLPTTRALDDEATGYSALAHALATFADQRLVNRRDVWGGYWPNGMRETLGKVYTAPRVKDRGRVLLAPSVLRQHFASRDAGDVIGLHSTSESDSSRWLAFDIDAHDETVTPETTRLSACYLAERLAERGAAVLLEDSDGAGGYHVWIHFEAPVATAAAYEWARRLADDCASATGLRPETFPKQASAAGAFGNWLRLPGRHHTRSHWSRVCRPGEAWASGADAATCVLSWPATPADVVPPVDAWPQPQRVHTPLVVATNDAPTDRARIIAAYVRRLPHGKAGSARSDRLFSLARFLRHGMQCSDAEALPVLHAWNSGNAPPLPEAKVLITWQNAATYASRPVAVRVSGRRHAA